MSRSARKRFKYSPFISAGVISVEELSRLVEAMKSIGAKNVKITGETVFVWDGTEEPPGFAAAAKYQANQFKFGGVRPVKMCSAETFCENYKLPVLSLAMRIDELFHNTHLEMKLLIGVAGCQRSCSEPATKDIGIIAHPQGYEIMVGGAAGFKPMVGKTLAMAATLEETIDLVGRIIDFCKIHGRRSARLGRIVEKMGMDTFRAHIMEGAPVSHLVFDGAGPEE
jgi:NAD(P)H-nitrite reductase large subunit